VTIEEVVRLVLRLWLAGAMNIGLLLGQVGSFLLAAVGFGGLDWDEQPYAFRVPASISRASR